MIPSDFAPAGRDVYSLKACYQSRFVGAQQLAALAIVKHSRSSRSEEFLRGIVVAINMSLLQSEEQFKVALLS
ncbi:MAG: hypothetical protein QOD75_1244 [Blastocatellia bacterium]|nr:hypothetical protein [Blastocatellia bacterium]